MYPSRVKTLFLLVLSAVLAGCAGLPRAQIAKADGSLGLSLASGAPSEAKPLPPLAPPPPAIAPANETTLAENPFTPSSVAPAQIEVAPADVSTDSPAETAATDTPSTFIAATNTAALQVAIATSPATQQAETPAATNDRKASWGRIAERFNLGDLEHPRVQAMARSYVRNWRNTSRMLEKAEPYLDEILPALEQRSMPGELVLLPAIESHYNPRAYSPQHAVGLWQFIPGTARNYGLRLSPWYDGRMDTRAATTAALDYLQFLQGRFGDWQLALAAYNAGEGRIDDALKNRGGGSYWNLRLPAETQQYVPRLLGLAAIIREPARYGVELPDFPLGSQLVRVELPGHVRFAEVARVSGLTLEELRQHNPACRRDATDPAGPHHIYLPASAARRLQKTPPRVIPEGDRFEQVYAVQPGDTLGSIAQRHGLRSSDVAVWNGLKTGSKPRAGDQLVLWLPRHKAPGGFKRLRYLVSKGETLEQVAQQFGLEIAKLCAWNDLSRDAKLEPGRRITLLLSQTSH